MMAKVMMREYLHDVENQMRCHRSAKKRAKTENQIMKASNNDQEKNQCQKPEHHEQKNNETYLMTT
jgi:hypothetical protein